MTLRQNPEYKAIMSILKRLLKERGISYKDLGKSLGLSESGVKKIFGSEDSSFGRLSEIAAVLGLKIFDLLEEAQTAHLEKLSFTEAQQNAFLKDYVLFSVFYKVTFERLSPEEAQKALGLTEAKIFRYLKRLDEIGLVDLLPGNKIRPPALRAVRNFGDGPFLRKLYKEWGVSLVHELAVPSFQEEGNFIVRSLQMKEDTYNEFLGRLRDLDAEFTRRGVTEMSVSTKSLKSMRWISLTDQNSFVR